MVHEVGPIDLLLQRLVLAFFEVAESSLKVVKVTCPHVDWSRVLQHLLPERQCECGCRIGCGCGSVRGVASVRKCEEFEGKRSEEMRVHGEAKKTEGNEANDGETVGGESRC